MKCIDERQSYDRVLELYDQLEEAKKMKVNNLASSLGRGATIREIESKILFYIDVQEDKEAIINLLKSKAI